MGLLKLTESERLEILNLHNNARIIKEQAAPAVSSSSTVPTAATTMDRKTLITKIQDKLLAKGYDLGPKGADGVLGPKTLGALTTAMANKSKAAPATATPATGTGTQLPTVTVTGQKAPDPAIAAAPKVPLSVLPPKVPGVSYQTTPATEPATAPATQGTDEFGAEAPQPQLSAQSQQALSGQLTPQQIRQQGRFDQRLARQARRNTRRAGQQEQ
jgi:peptidoglycan hydrolase-like protein with peptidoglycan-binding domain